MKKNERVALASLDAMTKPKNEAEYLPECFFTEPDCAVVKRNVQLQKTLDKRAKNFAMMSHEIRTPLNAVLGMANLLGTTKLNAEQREYLDVIETSGEHLLALLNDILDISKLEANKMELHAEHFVLGELLHESVMLFSAEAKRKGLQMHVALDGRIPLKVQGDPNRIKQILHNLISNAIKFTDDGGIKIKASLVENDSNNNCVLLCIEVEDSGVGLDREEQAMLFAPYTQPAAESRSRKGTGLGLAICKKLVDLMGGTIGVDSKKGIGSRFRFTVRLKLAR